MSGHRKAALALHALDERDRALVLAELAAADQVRLRAYLDELNELGFDPAAAGAAMPGARATGGADLDRADPAQLAQLLQGEPASLVAALLALRPWPWRDAFLAQLPAPRRGAIAAAAPGAAPARDRALAQAAAAQLRTMAPALPAAAPPGPWPSLLRRLSARMR